MRALKKQNKVDSTRDQRCQEFKAFKGSTQLTQVEPHFLPLTVQKVKRLAQLTCSQVGLISSTGRSGLEPMTHPLRDSWKGRLCTRFIRDTSPAYYEDWPAMLRTHCIGDTVVEHETWSVLCLITHCVTVLDMPLPLSLAIQVCAGNWENFPTRQSHNVIWPKTSAVSHITLESPVPFSSPVLRSFWSVPQMEWIAALETRMDPWQ